MPRRSWVLGLVVVAGCGGGGGGTTTPTPTTPVLSVGGSYTTAVALTENSCGSVDVQPLPTQVAHAAGSGSMQLTHGATYNCTLTGASFACQPQVFAVGGRTETVTVEGRFRVDGFDATARVAVQPSACAYAVAWTGTKQGAPNVLP